MPRPSFRSMLSVLGVVAALAFTPTSGLRADATMGTPPRNGPSMLRRVNCQPTEGALRAVAGELARREITDLGTESIASALRAAGDAHAFPRAFVVEGGPGNEPSLVARANAWLASFHGPGERRCGFEATKTAAGTVVLAAVAIDAAADAPPLPKWVRPGAWVRVEARALVPAEGAKVVVLGPRGTPRTVPSSMDDARIHATFSADAPGTWNVQVLLEGPLGARPILEWELVAGDGEPAQTSDTKAPGEPEGESADTRAPADTRAALRQMVNLARESEALAPLDASVALDDLAQQHARRMRERGDLGHDVGDGDPRSRVEHAGFPAHDVGENVAHAQTLALAHRALWRSPSHRQNLLEHRYDQVGVGAAWDSDGTVWVTELFASARRAALSDR